jgi:hypothetical protein
MELQAIEGKIQRYVERKAHERPSHSGQPHDLLPAEQDLGLVGHEEEQDDPAVDVPDLGWSGGALMCTALHCTVSSTVRTAASLTTRRTSS